MNKDYKYEKINDDYSIKNCPANDLDGSITGHFVMNVKAWFDEHPEERKRLGWIKHILHDEKDIDYNRQTQYLLKSVRVIDEYTVEDVFNVVDKSEEMMRLEELLEVVGSGVMGTGFLFT